MTANFLKIDQSVSSTPKLFKKASDWNNVEVPKREWHVDGLLPANQVTLISGDGGVGKSLVALQAAIATATNTKWIGRAINRPGPALYFTAEDTLDEIHRRIAAICGSQQIYFSNLTSLLVESRAAGDALLGTCINNQIAPTELLHQIDKSMRFYQPKLLVLDTLADIFGGNEIDRQHARQFIGLLRRLAVQNASTVVVLSHPSLSGLSSGTGMSGSTGWNASVRSRLYMRSADERGKYSDPDCRILSIKKANYARAGDEITLRWQNGYFENVGNGAQLDRQARAVKAEHIFLKLLDEFEREGRRVRHTTGAGYAPHEFHKSGRSDGASKYELRAAMEALFEKRVIKADKEGPPSRETSYIRRVQK